MSGVKASQLYRNGRGNEYRITLLTDGQIWFKIDGGKQEYGLPSEWFIKAIDAGRIFPVADQLELIQAAANE